MRRIAVFYVALAVGAAVVLSLVFSAGSGEHPAPVIGGKYGFKDPSGCLPAEFDLRQSGQFISLSNEDGSVSGKLRLREGTLDGTVECLDGESAELDAKLSDDKLVGRLGEAAFAPLLLEEQPPAGTRKKLAPDSVAGTYAIVPKSACLGTKIELDGDGSEVELSAKGVSGSLSYEDGSLAGTVTCSDATSAELTGTAADREIDLTITRPPAAGAEPPPPAEIVKAQKQREFPKTLAAFFIAAAFVMLIARLFGTIAVKLAQPRVMGEVIAGIALGPTIFGALLPDLQTTLFPTDIIPLIGVVANLGLIFYMFMVGLELDPAALRGRVTQALAISNASVLLPLTLGVLVALPVYELTAPDVDFGPFALFMGVAMSITAFPVLARILVERRMLKRPVGAITMASAAIDDVTAWFLIALASTIAVAGSNSEVIETIVLAAAFCVAMFFAVRPVLARMSGSFDEAGRVPGTWIVAIFAGVLFSAYATEQIGIALIFGAFVMGMVMPRHAGLTEDVTGRIEDFVVILLLPLFFAYTGLRTDIGLLDRPELWLLTLLLIAVAITGKMVGAFVAARLTGFSNKASGVIGILMNTRGLTELIVLNLALEKGVISEALFAALVIMALVTTFMAGPLLRLIDRNNEFGEPVEEDFRRAREASILEHPTLSVPDREILIAPQSDAAVEQLLRLGEPLARSEPPRELIIARLVAPPRGAAAGVRGGLQTEDRLLAEATAEVEAARERLIATGVAARSVAFISTQPGADLVRVVESEEVDLVLIDGHRPLLGGSIPRGEVGMVLNEASCDVGVLVAAEGKTVVPASDAPVVVPFGGAEHDWAALELGAWIAAAFDAPLTLLGAAGDASEADDVTRRLSDAGVLIRQFSGVSPETVVIEPGRSAVIEASTGAGLLVIGLSSRWREEGLGATRTEIAKASAAPILFARRGSPAGGHAPAAAGQIELTGSTPTPRA